MKAAHYWNPKLSEGHLPAKSVYNTRSLKWCQFINIKTSNHAQQCEINHRFIKVRYGHLYERLLDCSE